MLSPADGWVVLVYNKATNTYAEASIVAKNGNQDNLSTRCSSNYNNAMVSLPVTKNQTFQIRYAGAELGRFKFIYAVGSSPTA